MPPPNQQDVVRDLRAGLAHHQAGRLRDAETIYRKVLKRFPEHPDALNLLGVIVHEQGRPARAVQLFSRALRAKPEFPEAFTNLARARRADGDLQGALDAARRAVALNAALAEGQVQLGCALLDTCDYAGAAEALRTATQLAPGSLDAHVNLAAALTYLRDWEAAAKVYQTAHALKPDRAETLTDYAKVLHEMRLYSSALRCHERAAELAPNDPRVHAGHALTLKRAQDPAGAVAACNRTLALDPLRADIWILLGASLAALGQFTEAAAAYERALGIDPSLAEARRGQVVSGQLAADETELQRLRLLADDLAQSDPVRISAAAALGGLFDKAQDYDQAFYYHALSNQLSRQVLEADGRAFRRDAFRHQVDALIEGWTPEAFAALRDCGEPTELPVFIVGMPRSGTSLTEQIAASHPQVFGAGELRDIGVLSLWLARHSPVYRPIDWDHAVLRDAAGKHLARLRALGGAARRVIDKMPDNLLWLGPIAVLFPNARIVLCRRDPRDTCLSCFFQHFGPGLSWTQDLSDLAFRTRQIERLVAHWREVLPVPMLELHYEKLVADLEGESRRLIDFLGLEWDPACLAFHQTDRPVLTASLWQVRQPLYASSVGRWRHYRAHLGPLLEGLTDLIPGNLDALEPATTP